MGQALKARFNLALIMLCIKHELWLHDDFAAGGPVVGAGERDDR
jgi:uncharacterized membrane protein